VRLVWRPRGAIKNDKIREMEDCRSLGEATKLAKRFAATLPYQ
jgi:hypothetical protein